MESRQFAWWARSLSEILFFQEVHVLFSSVTVHKGSQRDNWKWKGKHSGKTIKFIIVAKRKIEDLSYMEYGV